MSSIATDRAESRAADRDALRVAFVGQSVYFRQCALESTADGIEPTFLDFRSGASAEPLLARIRHLEPDAVVVFRPEIIPADLFAGLDAVRIGYLTEPLPRGGDAEHEDLRLRMWWLEQVDSRNFDLVVSFDPLIAATATSVIPVWRSMPLPVADSVFSPPPARKSTPRMLFVGRSTKHREQLLAPLKARYPLVHIGHGLHREQLRRAMAQADVQLNLHNNPYPSFENRVSIALAAGNLVVSEPLSPEHGLVPGRDFVQVQNAEELLAVAERLHADRDAFLEVQLAGRARAERFRALRVYPPLLREALIDTGVRRGQAVGG